MDHVKEIAEGTTDIRIDLVNRPLPENMGLAVDTWHKVNALRLNMQKQVDSVAAYASALNDHIIAGTSKRDERGAVGHNYKAVVKAKRTPVLKDKDAFWQFARHLDRSDFFEARPAKAVIEKWVEDGNELPPGLEWFNAVSLSVTKI